LDAFEKKDIKPDLFDKADIPKDRDDPAGKYASKLRKSTAKIFTKKGLWIILKYQFIWFFFKLVIYFILKSFRK